MAARAWDAVPESDYEEVSRLLGRKPDGIFQVVARSAPANLPAVIACWPIILPDRPMPTLFWLLDPRLTKEVSSLEAAGIVKEIRKSVDSQDLSRVHARYASIRDALIPPDYTGPRPSGGIGGTRGGFKCLHSHVAWYLMSKEDPVVAWVMEHYAGSLSIDAVTVCDLPVGLRALNSSR